MKYDNFCYARFISRPNRFVAIVEVNGKTETVHVKNTGRCKELLLPGSKVVLTCGSNPLRKTRYDLISVWKENLGWVNIDSQAPNKVVLEWLKGGKSIFRHLDLIKPEYTFGKSRVDFYMEKAQRKILLEVKGCTLEIEKEGYFPDAPTERGVKHLHELAKAVKQGYECYLAFVIAMPKVKMVHPNVVTHPDFGKALSAAQKAGVKILYLTCDVEPDSLVIVKGR